MVGTTITSREFNRDVSAAKRAAEQGPVTITEHIELELLRRQEAKRSGISR